jgi:CRISPR-associated protein Csm5
MKAENAVLRERGYVPADWLNRLEELVKKQIDKGGAFLIRLGRYNSAEDKTLENFAKITIKGQKGAPTTVKEASTTLWLAADAKKQTSGMTPFGWALAEIDPQGENESLKAWCQQERQGRPDMEPLRKQLREQQEQRAAEKAARVEQEHLAEVKAEEEAAMTEEQRQLADLCAKLTQHPLFKGRDVGDTLLKECENILTAAAAWPPEDKRALLERLPPLLAEKECYQGRYEKIFKKLLKALS